MKIRINFTSFLTVVQILIVTIMLVFCGLFFYYGNMTFYEKYKIEEMSIVGNKLQDEFIEQKDFSELIKISKLLQFQVHFRMNTIDNSAIKLSSNNSPSSTQCYDIIKKLSHINRSFICNDKKFIYKIIKMNSDFDLIIIDEYSYHLNKIVNVSLANLIIFTSVIIGLCVLYSFMVYKIIIRPVLIFNDYLTGKTFGNNDVVFKNATIINELNQIFSSTNKLFEIIQEMNSLMVLFNRNVLDHSNFLHDLQLKGLKEDGQATDD